MITINPFLKKMLQLEFRREFSNRKFIFILNFLAVLSILLGVKAFVLIIGLVSFLYYAGQISNYKKRNQPNRVERLLLPLSPADLLKFSYCKSALESFIMIFPIISVFAAFVFLDHKPMQFSSRLGIIFWQLMLLAIIPLFSARMGLVQAKISKFSEQGVVDFLRNFSMITCLILVIGYFSAIIFFPNPILIVGGALLVIIYFFFVNVKTDLRFSFLEHDHYKSLKFNFLFDGPIALLFICFCGSLLFTI